MVLGKAGLDLRLVNAVLWYVDMQFMLIESSNFWNIENTTPGCTILLTLPFLFSSSVSPFPQVGS